MEQSTACKIPHRAWYRSHTLTRQAKASYTVKPNINEAGNYTPFPERQGRNRYIILLQSFVGLHNCKQYYKPPQALRLKCLFICLFLWVKCKLIWDQTDFTLFYFQHLACHRCSMWIKQTQTHISLFIHSPDVID